MDFQKDRYNDARNIHTMQHYIEDKMKESIPTTTITMTTTTKPPTLHKPVENAAYVSRKGSASLVDHVLPFAD